MTLGTIYNRVLTEIEVDPTDALWKFAAIAAINEAQRIFSFLTLCLISTETLTTTPGTSAYRMLSLAANWIVPLRAELAAGAKLRPETLYQMAANDPAWLNSGAAATRYGTLGWDLLFLNGNGAATLIVTYARCCAPLAADSDVPEIPLADHEALINYGIARLRANEGGAELSNASGLVSAYLATAKLRAQKVREASLAAGYEPPLFEIKLADLSRKVK